MGNQVEDDSMVPLEEEVLMVHPIADTIIVVDLVDLTVMHVMRLSMNLGILLVEVDMVRSLLAEVVVRCFLQEVACMLFLDLKMIIILMTKIMRPLLRLRRNLIDITSEEVLMLILKTTLFLSAWLNRNNVMLRVNVVKDLVYPIRGIALAWEEVADLARKTVCVEVEALECI